MSGTDTLYQQLREHLHTLGLTAAADRLAPALDAAERDKPLEQFDYSAQPGLDRRLIDDLATLRFVEEHANVLLIGPRGLVLASDERGPPRAWSTRAADRALPAAVVSRRRGMAQHTTLKPRT